MTRNRLTRWVVAVLGALTVGIGLYVLVRPISSLSLLVILIVVGLILTGVSRIVGADDTPGAVSRVVGVLWVAAGVAVLVWPDMTVRLLVVVVAGWLIGDGVVDVASVFHRGADERLASILKGVASVVFGVLALTWPDVTILVVALVFAVKLVVVGVSQIVTSSRGHPKGDEDEPRGRLRRWARVLSAALALLVALGLAGISSLLNSGTPVVDDFYAAPADLPAEPGALLRVEPFDRGIPDDADGWRILYTTTRDKGIPAVASALVVAPEGMTAPAPVIAWAHGTTGVDETCAPSLLEETFSTGAFFSVEEVIEKGWVLVAPDYVGLGTQGPHPYLIGQGEGRSVLDGVRAARHVDGLALEERTVVWGHSQGGHAALWTGLLATDYAPDVNVIAVAALAPASDPIGLMEALPEVTGGSIFASYLLSAYSDIYDDVDLTSYVVPGGSVTINQIAGRCLAEPSVLTSVLSSVAVNFSMFRPDLATGSLGVRLDENVPPYDIEVPLLLAQGGSDGLIKPEMQDAYVEGLCASGREVDYRVYDGLGHVPLVEAGSPLIPELLDWTRARFDGEEPTPTC